MGKKSFPKKKKSPEGGQSLDSEGLVSSGLKENRVLGFTHEPESEEKEINKQIIGGMGGYENC